MKESELPDDYMSSAAGSTQPLLSVTPPTFETPEMEYMVTKNMGDGL